MPDVEEQGLQFLQTCLRGAALEEASTRHGKPHRVL